MGSTLSTVSLTTFEVFNEVFVAVGAGIAGIVILAHHGITTNHLFRTFAVGTFTTASLLYAFQWSEYDQPSRRKVVLITGCDSGLGYSLAQHSHELGFTILAGCFDLNSRGSQMLQEACGDKLRLVELDVTDNSSVAEAVAVVEKFLTNNPDCVLWAVVNNAGIMVFGEFEWLTDSLIRRQLDVNLAGTFRLTKAFCPLLRKYKGRIMTVTSHCAKATLPGLAVYGATKAGLQAWSDGLRVELGKYGVKVITFIPGSFPQNTNIMARQVENVYEMHASLSQEQHEFYDEYFKRYNAYLSFLKGPIVPKKIDDFSLYEEYEKAMLAQSPKPVYTNQQFRYAFYHIIFKYSPVHVRDIFITRFMQMPDYQPNYRIVADGIA